MATNFTPSPRSKFISKSRLNVESALEFISSGNTYIDLGTGLTSFYSNYSGIFSFSVFLYYDGKATGSTYGIYDGGFFGEPRVNVTYNESVDVLNFIARSGSTSTVQSEVLNGRLLNKWNHLYVYYNSSTLDTRMYLNGDELTIPNVTQTVTFFGSEVSRLGSYISGGEEWSGFMSHAIFFDTLLTEDQIEYIRANGGVISSDLHQNVLAHYPMTQRYAYSASTAATGNMIYNVVEQYNYAKDEGTILTHTYSANDKFLVNGVTANTFTEGDILTLDTNAPANNAVYAGNGSVAVGEYVRYKFRIRNWESPIASVSFNLMGPSNSNVIKYQPTIVSGNTIVTGFVKNEGTAIRNVSTTWNGVDDGNGINIELLEWREATTSLGAATANHGLLVNYTDDQVGSVNPSSQSVFKDFYDKLVNRANFIELTNPREYTSSNTTNDLNDSDFTIEALFTRNGGTCRVFESNADPSTATFFQVTVSSSVLYLNGSSGGAPGKILGFSGGINPNEIPAHFVVTYDKTTGEGRMYRNGKFTDNDFSDLPNSLLLASPLRFCGNNWNGKHFFTRVYSRKATDAEIVQLYANRFKGIQNMPILSDVVWSAVPTGEDGDNSYKDEFDDSITYTAPTLVSADFDSGVARFKERKSLMPPRTKALRFTAANSHYLRVPSFNPTNELGYTYIFGFRLPTNKTNFDLGDQFFQKQDATYYKKFVGSNGTRGIRMNSLGSGGLSGGQYILQSSIDLRNLNVVVYREINTSLNPQPDFPSSNTVYRWNLNDVVDIFKSNASNPIVGYNEISDDLEIGGDSSLSRYGDKDIFYLAIFKGVLSNDEVQRFVNSTFVRNPSLEIQNKYDLQLFIDFNNPFDDLGTLKFPDLSPNNHIVEAVNWTNITDLQNSLVDIDSLRFL